MKLLKIQSNTFNADGKRVYPQNLNQGESAYRLEKNGWVLKTTMVEFNDTGGIPKMKLDMTLVFMPDFRGKCES